ncbi:MAG: DNA translocase FtsK [Nitrospinae bacterium]|nr:DNA translocase FtsK [Nitrospinota bacterium]
MGRKKRSQPSPPRRPTVNRRRRTVLREVLGVFLWAGALYLLLSLLSFHPTDPSFNRYLDPAPPVQNLGGGAGAYLSDALVVFGGAGAYLFPLFLVLFGIALCWGDRFGRGPLAILSGALMLLLSVCGLLGLSLKSDPLFSSQPMSGGILGDLIARGLEGSLNTGGAYLVLGAFLLVSFLLATPLSLGSALSAIRRGWVHFLQYVKDRSPRGAAASSKRRAKNRPSSAGEGGADVAERPDFPDGPIPKKRKASPSAEETELSEPPKRPDGTPGWYRLPALSLLDDPPPLTQSHDEKELRSKGDLLEKKLMDFGIQGQVLQILRGPVITTYEFEPASGIKVSRIMNLSDDLALAMKALSVRILAPVPRKAVVGIEIPNDQREPVCLKEILTSPAFSQGQSKLTIALGKDVSGKPVATDLAQIPHLLIAGATGSGKSVGLNCIICSLLFSATPEEVRLIMIDPKMLELSVYDGIPHLISPVVTDPKKAAVALKWAVAEMERRYRLMAEKGVRGIAHYNQWVKESAADWIPTEGKEEPDSLSQSEIRLPYLHYIVVVIDELADLMMVSSKEVETSLARLAQMARAAGIHLLVATQRPSVDVLTGVIKANFPSRISFQVSSRVDSRTILDSIGAERLLGKGDLLFLPPGTSQLVRVHGAYVSEKEIKRLVDFLKQQQAPTYDESVLRAGTEEGDVEEGEYDEKYEEAVQLVAQTRQASISMIQRRLRIGYNRAARIIEIMEKEGLVGPADGAKPREVYIKREDFF